MNRILKAVIVSVPLWTMALAGSVQGSYSDAGVPASVVEASRKPTRADWAERTWARVTFWRASRAILPPQARSAPLLAMASLNPSGGASPSEELLMCLLGITLTGAGLAGRKRRHNDD
jgi:hypothetical protein